MTQHIPVYINSFNRLQWVKDMVSHLRRMPGAYPVIVDNASTYPPLVEWMREQKDLSICYLNRNAGPRGAWDLASGVAQTNPDHYYVITDPDLDISGCPDDTLELLQRGLDDHPEVVKVGLSLKIDDIPDEYPWKARALQGEEQFYTSQLPDGFYKSMIDTTFCMMRPGKHNFEYGPALRSPPPYQARHIPWYQIPGTLTEEDRYYLDSIPQGWKSGMVYSTLAIDEAHKLR